MKRGCETSEGRESECARARARREDLLTTVLSAIGVRDALSRAFVLKEGGEEVNVDDVLALALEDTLHVVGPLTLAGTCIVDGLTRMEFNARGDAWSNQRARDAHYAPVARRDLTGVAHLLGRTIVARRVTHQFDAAVMAVHSMDRLARTLADSRVAVERPDTWLVVETTHGDVVVLHSAYCTGNPIANVLTNDRTIARNKAEYVVDNIVDMRRLGISFVVALPDAGMRFADVEEFTPAFAGADLLCVHNEAWSRAAVNALAIFLSNKNRAIIGDRYERACGMPFDDISGAEMVDFVTIREYDQKYCARRNVPTSRTPMRPPVSTRADGLRAMIEFGLINELRTRTAVSIDGCHTDSFFETNEYGELVGVGVTLAQGRTSADMQTMFNVAALRTIFSQFTTQLPNTIAVACTGLRELHLPMFSGAVPDFVGELWNLEQLVLGPIVCDELPEPVLALARHRRLEMLGLPTARIANIDGLQNFNISLRELTIRNDARDFDHVVAQLHRLCAMYVYAHEPVNAGALPKRLLTRLTIRGNVGDISELASATHLRELRVIAVEIPNLAFVAGMPSLRTIELGPAANAPIAAEQALNAPNLTFLRVGSVPSTLTQDIVGLRSGDSDDYATRAAGVRCTTELAPDMLQMRTRAAEHEQRRVQAEASDRRAREDERLAGIEEHRAELAAAAASILRTTQAIEQVADADADNEDGADDDADSARTVVSFTVVQARHDYDSDTEYDSPTQHA